MSRLSELQALVNARLASLTLFQATTTTVTIPILNEDTHDLDTEISKAVEQTAGLVVLIGQPKLVNLQPGSFPANVSVEFEIGVGESVLLNRDPELTTNTKQPAGDVAQAIFQRLHGWQPNFAWKKLSVSEAVPIPDKKRQVYQLQVSTQIILAPI